MRTGWFKCNNTLYFLKPDGGMAVGTFYYNGLPYQASVSGQVSGGGNEYTWN